MKPWGIGMMIVLIGLALNIGAYYLDYYWIQNPPETAAEYEDYSDQTEMARTLLLAGNIIALVGVAVFIYEFMKHEHKS